MDSGDKRFWCRIIADAMLWLVVSVVFGLLQLWISVGYEWYGEQFNSLNIYFLSGVLLFFCSATVITSSFDIWLEDSISKRSRFYISFHIILPFIVVLWITVIYLATFKANSLSNNVRNSQFHVLAISLFYSTFSKIELSKARYNQ